jgi:hypothetical protein
MTDVRSQQGLVGASFIHVLSPRRSAPDPGTDSSEEHDTSLRSDNRSTNKDIMKPQALVVALISMAGVCDALGQAWFYTGE